MAKRVWLYPADHLSELERVQRLEHHRPRGWRTRAFTLDRWTWRPPRP